MAKRRSNKRGKGHTLVKRSYLIGGSFAILVLLGLFWGLWSYSIGSKEPKKTLQKHSTSSLEMIKQKERQALREVLSEVEDYKENASSSSSKSLVSSSSKSSYSSKESGLSSSISKSRSSYKKEKSIQEAPRKPKLAIIIDDVAFHYQVDAIRSLHMPINLSFFPPSHSHPFTTKYAKSFRHYMIHLPLEATRYKREEEDTLHVTSSYGDIERVIKKIRREFPRAIYINNHTGSKFTADLSAMRRLISVLDRYDFKFLDSRTTARSKVPKVMRELGRPYLHRDIFLDNDPSIPAIKAQIQKAVVLARKKGFAIAIGHPHKNTIKALRQSKKLLKTVHLIYIDQL